MRPFLLQRIRLYGADCNQTSFVLDAIQRTKVNMTVYVGNYVVPSDNTAYMRQRGELQTAFQSFGVDNVVGGFQWPCRFCLYIDTYMSLQA